MLAGGVDFDLLTIAGVKAAEEGDGESSTTRRASALLAFWELLRRNGLNLLLNPGIVLTRVAMYAMLAGLIAILYYQSSEGTLSSSYAITSRVAVLFYIGAFM